MEQKPKHDASGVDPFTYAKAEKRVKLEKQKLDELKNKVHASSNTKKNKDVKILAAASSAGEKSTSSLKLKEEAERNSLRKREQKSLMKSLKLA